MDKSQKISVLYLLGALQVGGTEMLMLDLLQKAGQSRTLSCHCIYRKEGVLLCEFQNLAVPLTHLPSNGKFDWKRIFKLRSYVKKHQIQLIHAHQPLDIFYAYWATIGMKIKLVVSFHGYDLFHTKFSTKITRFMSKRVDLNLFVSHSLKKFYESVLRFYPGKQEVLYNGVNQNKFSAKVSNIDLRSQFELVPNIPIFISVGSFIPVRNQLLLCKACHLLQQRGLDYALFFVGRPDANFPVHFQECLNYVKDNRLEKQVYFLEERTDVPQLLKQASAYVYATHQDSFGISVVEAMMANLPVFVNDAEVMLEITQNGKYANIFHDEAQLANLLESFSLKFQNEGKSSNDSFNFAVENYSMEKHLKDLENHYRKLVKSNG